MAKHKGLISLISSVVEKLAQVADPSRKQETRHGDGTLPPAEVSVTGEIATAAAVNEYQDVVVEVLLAAAVAAEKRIQNKDPKSLEQTGLGTGIPSPIETTRSHGTPSGHANETGRQDVQTGEDFGKGALTEVKEGDSKTGEETEHTVEPVHPLGDSSTTGPGTLGELPTEAPIEPETLVVDSEVHGEPGQAGRCQWS